MFTQKIKVKYKDETSNRLKVIDKGEWIDLSVHLKDCSTIETYKDNGSLKIERYFHQGDYGMLDLNVAMELPAGFEAPVVPRSSTWKSGMLQMNSVGIIDKTYCGDDDWWRFPYYMFMDGKLEHNQRICQFRIQLSQKATVWQKLKWLFTSKIEFIEVEHLGNENRGGFGTTGKTNIN
jgi:dUTP pyrophosphatase